MGNRRIWWGVGIMAAGLCAAWPFRKTWLDEQEALVAEALSLPAGPLTMQPLRPTRLKQVEPDETSPAIESISPETPAVAGLHPLTSALNRPAAQRALARVEQAPPLPDLAADFSPHSPLDPRAAVLGEDTSPVITSQPAPPASQRRYRILKHDTLESIAERLLGSRQHADKLLAANSEVILAPEVLPVGAMIVIPDISLPSESVVRLPENGM